MRDSDERGEWLKPEAEVEIRVVEGPFQDFEGVVEKVNPGRARIRARISFFGRETPVELDFDQVERLN